MKTALIRIIILATLMIAMGKIMTAHAQKIRGALIHSPAEIAAVTPYSNTLGILYTPGTLASFEAENTANLDILIVISNYLQDDNTGLFGADITALAAEIQQLNASHGWIIMIDEPEWLTRQACRQGKQQACHDAAQNYPLTRANLTQAAANIRAALPGVRIAHNMAYAEIILQMREQGEIHMLPNVDLYGFDCYGAWNACGDPEHGYVHQAWLGGIVYAEMMRHESAQPAGRQMLLIPGAFDSESFYNQHAIIAQLEAYRPYHNQPYVAVSGLFYYRGYADKPLVNDYVNNVFAEW